MGFGFKGKKHTDETRLKMSESHRGLEHANDLPPSEAGQIAFAQRVIAMAAARERREAKERRAERKRRLSSTNF